VTDHFALREAFRTLNTVLRVDVLGQPDSGGVFEAEGYLFEPAWPMDEQAILNNTAKMQWITDTYFADKPVYFSIVPDKADFTDEPCLKLDTEHVVELVSENFGGEYIDITDTLSLGDYYRTDTHWQQDKLGDTADALVSGMGGTLPESAFEWITLDGVFHGYDELDNERIDLDFCWVPLEQFARETVYPVELKPHILRRMEGVFHFVSNQLDV